ncbi:MAG: DUF2917 domain-containing protein [Burkholderiales bacterium]|nr:DUF2917 domain-containing protein [Burkholderiales bacterium]
MAPHTHPLMHQSSPTLPGTWKLAPGRAITLQPVEPGTMKVAHGCVWATYDGPHHGALNDLGDHVIGVGDRLFVRAGQRLVIQAWDRHCPAYFSWDPAPEPARVRRLSLAPVLQPMADLRLALAIGGIAIARLVVGLARVLRDYAAPKAQPECPHAA